MDEIRDKLARYLFFEWKEQKEAEGYHLPEKCPNFEDDYDKERETADRMLIHCRKCNVHMCGFEKLEEFKKHTFLEKAGKMLQQIEQFDLKIINL